VSGRCAEPHEKAGWLASLESRPFGRPGFQWPGLHPVRKTPMKFTPPLPAAVPTEASASEVIQHIRALGLLPLMETTTNDEI
jgi:hypothetical protein